MIRLSEKDISKQEVLSLERLKNLSSSKGIRSNLPVRPEGSLINLIYWSKRIVQNDNLNVILNDKINIDGSFLSYCEDKNIKINSILFDAFSSWNSDYDDEHFICTGIFKIIFGDNYFYHCALFHKGNQNEDEVSFYILVDDKNYESYINFRNEFSDWQKKRERESLEIEVIGGDPIPYSLDVSFDSIFLPEKIKNQITTTIDGFLKSKELYKKLNVPWGRGMGFWGERGCGKTSMLRAIMAKYPELKPVTVQFAQDNPNAILSEAFEYAADHSPSLFFIEDLQEYVKTIEIGHFLQLLDGLQKRDGILTIVTGNDFSSLEKNLKSRPRRFDSFFEFPLPDQAHTEDYLKKKFVDISTDGKIFKSVVKKAVKNKFTYAHLQEVYFSSVFIAIPNGRENPNENDLNDSFNQVLDLKNSVDMESGERDLTDYYDSRKEDSL